MSMSMKTIGKIYEHLATVVISKFPKYRIPWKCPYYNELENTISTLLFQLNHLLPLVLSTATNAGFAIQRLLIVPEISFEISRREMVSSCLWDPPFTYNFCCKSRKQLPMGSFHGSVMLSSLHPLKQFSIEIPFSCRSIGRRLSVCTLVCKCESFTWPKALVQHIKVNWNSPAAIAQRRVTFIPHLPG